VIDFVTVLVLARTLTPADFGLTALATTLIAIVDTVLEIPLLQALTRLKCVEKSHLDTAFTLGVLRGLLVSLVVLAAARPFSIIFHDSRLTALVAALATGPIARSLYSPLGQYTMANDLSVLPTQSLIGPAMQPVMAAFSRIIDDPERLGNA
jgi:O-antigen/teichoic acid export membrane protein